jgi:hypothetical protein
LASRQDGISLAIWWSILSTTHSYSRYLDSKAVSGYWNTLVFVVNNDAVGWRILSSGPVTTSGAVFWQIHWDKGVGTDDVYENFDNVNWANGPPQTSFGDFASAANAYSFAQVGSSGGASFPYTHAFAAIAAAVSGYLDPIVSSQVDTKDLVISHTSGLDPTGHVFIQNHIYESGPKGSRQRAVFTVWAQDGDPDFGSLIPITTRASALYSGDVGSDPLKLPAPNIVSGLVNTMRTTGLYQK